VILATLFGLILLIPGSRTAALLKIVHSLPPLFIAVFVVYFKKSNFDLDTFFREFQHVGHKEKGVVSVAVMVAFVVLILDQERVEGGAPDLGPFLIQTLSATIAVGLIDVLKVTRSKAGDWAQVVRRSPHSVARGLARAFHSYLTNVIVGVDGVSWPHRTTLHDWLVKQRLKNDEFTWIGDKVLVLFPDSSRIKDSVADLLERERNEGGCLGLVNQRVEHQYEMAGKMRQSVLHVIKLRHSGDNGWRNNYFIFAENRPLIALHQMKAAGLLTENQFRNQFQLYQRELEQLLEKDVGCRDMYEVVKYQEGLKISDVLRQRVLKIESIWLESKS